MTELISRNLEGIWSSHKSLTITRAELYRRVGRPSPRRQIAVMIPEMVERHWFLQFLHNQRGSVLKALLYLKGNQRIIVINAPWYLKS